LRRIRTVLSINNDLGQKTTKIYDTVLGCGSPGKKLGDREQSKPLLPLRRSTLQSSEPLFLRSLSTGRSRRITIGSTCVNGMIIIQYLRF
jgi:hypothetical protein